MAVQGLADSVSEHRNRSSLSAKVAVITLSTSRAREKDTSGDIIQQLLEDAGHQVLVRRLLPDSREALQATLRELEQEELHCVITTGGTGLTPTDVTIEAVRPLLDKELPGFSALFMLLSYPEVKSAAMLSRALAGTIKEKIIFCLPGSPRACKLATESLILPELSHILMLLGYRA